MKFIILLLIIPFSTTLAGSCDEILDLGFPIVGKCNVTSDKILNVKSQIKIKKAEVCWGSYGTKDDGENAVSVEMKSEQGETIKYTWTMPTGRANRKSINDYTYFGKWKKGVFYEDQTTVRDDKSFFKPILRQGVVINYPEKQIEIVKTYKKFFGRMNTIIDAYLDCGDMRPFF